MEVIIKLLILCSILISSTMAIGIDKCSAIKKHIYNPSDTLSNTVDSIVNILKTDVDDHCSFYLFGRESFAWEDSLLLRLEKKPADFEIPLGNWFKTEDTNLLSYFHKRVVSIDVKNNTDRNMISIDESHIYKSKVSKKIILDSTCWMKYAGGLWDVNFFIERYKECQKKIKPINEFEELKRLLMLRINVKFSNVILTRNNDKYLNMELSRLYSGLSDISNYRFPIVLYFISKEEWINLLLKNDLRDYLDYGKWQPLFECNLSFAIDLFKEKKDLTPWLLYWEQMSFRQKIMAVDIFGGEIIPEKSFVGFLYKIYSGIRNEIPFSNSVYAYLFIDGVKIDDFVLLYKSSVDRNKIVNMQEASNLLSFLKERIPFRKQSKVSNKVDAVKFWCNYYNINSYSSLLKIPKRKIKEIITIIISENLGVRDVLYSNIGDVEKQLMLCLMEIASAVHSTYSLGELRAVPSNQMPLAYSGYRLEDVLLWYDYLSALHNFNSDLKIALLYLKNKKNKSLVNVIRTNGSKSGITKIIFTYGLFESLDGMSKDELKTNVRIILSHLESTESLMIFLTHLKRKNFNLFVRLVEVMFEEKIFYLNNFFQINLLKWLSSNGINFDDNVRFFAYHRDDLVLVSFSNNCIKYRLPNSIELNDILRNKESYSSRLYYYALNKINFKRMRRLNSIYLDPTFHNEFCYKNSNVNFQNIINIIYQYIFNPLIYKGQLLVSRCGSNILRLGVELNHKTNILWRVEYVSRQIRNKPRNSYQSFYNLDTIKLKIKNSIRQFDSEIVYNLGVGYMHHFMVIIRYYLGGEEFDSFCKNRLKKELCDYFKVLNNRTRIW